MSSSMFALLRAFSSFIQGRFSCFLGASDLVEGEGEGMVCMGQSTMVGEDDVKIGGVTVCSKSDMVEGGKVRKKVLKGMRGPNE